MQGSRSLDPANKLFNLGGASRSESGRQKQSRKPNYQKGYTNNKIKFRHDNSRIARRRDLF